MHLQSDIQSLSGGWIAFIVIMCLLLIVVVACLVFLIWTGRLVCWCLRRDKARESRKTKRKAKDFNSQTISTQTPSTVEQKYQRRLNEAEVHVEVRRADCSVRVNVAIVDGDGNYFL